METTPPDTVTALLIEDSDDDAQILRRLAESCSLDVRFERIADGEAAIDYLTARITAAGGASAPYFVLLDLSLPRVDGIEILRRLKSDALLADVPVIILSGTRDEEHIRQGQDLKAHTHIVKPMTLTEFTWIVQSIQSYWPRLQRLRALSPRT
jgi:CheY-like chemotaxis protein